jgi:hypothetical protein
MVLRFEVGVGVWGDLPPYLRQPTASATAGLGPCAAPTIGILQNPIYRGEVVRNRSEWVKDHETGRRRRFERPESEWVRRTEPELRIIAGEIAAAVEAEQKRRSAAYVRTPEGASPRTQRVPHAANTSSPASWSAALVEGLLRP